MDVPLDYVRFQISDEFVVGHSLDYLEKCRDLTFIGMLNLEVEEEI